MTFTRRLFLKLVPFLFVRPPRSYADVPQPFGAKFPNLDSLTTGEWWSKGTLTAAPNANKKAKSTRFSSPRHEYRQDQRERFHRSLQFVLRRRRS